METGISTEPRQNVVNPMPYKTCEFSLLICSLISVYSIGLCLYNKNLYLYESTQPWQVTHFFEPNIFPLQKQRQQLYSLKYLCVVD